MKRITPESLSQGTPRKQKIERLTAFQEEDKENPDVFYESAEYLESVKQQFDKNEQAIKFQWDEKTYGGPYPGELDDVLRAWKLRDSSFVRKKEGKIRSQERCDDIARMKLGEIEALLESTLVFAINHGQAYGDGESFAEHGSQYDDYAAGADVVIGLKGEKKDGEDLIFSLDAFAGEDPEKAETKFEHHKGAPYAPLCNTLKYRSYIGEDGKAHRKYVGIAPNYIIGIARTAIQGYVDNHISLSNDWSKMGIEPGNPFEAEKMRNKILTQIYLQSFAGYCEAYSFTQRPPENTSKDELEIAKEVKEMHYAIYKKTATTLMKVFGINPKDKNCLEQLNKYVFDYGQREPYDKSFKLVFSKSAAEYRAANQKAIAISRQNMARKAKKAAEDAAA